MRCGPASHTSPGCVTAGPALGSASAGIVLAFGGRSKVVDQQVDLRDLEPGGFDAEIELRCAQRLQLLRQQLLIPACILGEFVIGDQKRLRLLGREVFEHDCGDFAPPQLPASEDAPVPGQDLVLRIDQDRHVESERANAPCDLFDLLLAVNTRVVWVELKGGELAIDDRNAPWDCRGCLCTRGCEVLRRHGWSPNAKDWVSKPDARCHWCKQFLGL